jgi:2-polyprenyl-6-methoxyphenol hydroxylase-like FAD-dependent oxidoreductase
MADRVVIVGAGAVGLSCAYFLQRAGFDVDVIDAGPVGNGASWGNAGWIFAIAVRAHPRTSRAPDGAGLDRKADQPAVSAAAPRSFLPAVGDGFPTALHAPF